MLLFEVFQTYSRRGWLLAFGDSGGLLVFFVGSFMFKTRVVSYAVV